MKTSTPSNLLRAPVEQKGEEGRTLPFGTGTSVFLVLGALDAGTHRVAPGFSGFGLRLSDSVTSSGLPLGDGSWDFLASRIRELIPIMQPLTRLHLYPLGSVSLENTHEEATPLPAAPSGAVAAGSLRRTLVSHLGDD